MATSGRKTYRDQLLEAQKANDHYALLAGKPKLDYGTMIKPPPVKRTLRKPSSAGSSSGEPLESAIQKQIIGFLRAHPKIHKVIRINSGVAQNTDAHGTTRYTRFNSEAGIADIIGMLRGGLFFALEVKRPPFAGPRNSREHDQEAFLASIREGGGRAGFATCVEDVKRILGI